MDYKFEKLQDKALQLFANGKYYDIDKHLRADFLILISEDENDAEICLSLLIGDKTLELIGGYILDITPKGISMLIDIDKLGYVSQKKKEKKEQTWKKWQLRFDVVGKVFVIISAIASLVSLSLSIYNFQTREQQNIDTQHLINKIKTEIGQVKQQVYKLVDSTKQ